MLVFRLEADNGLGPYANFNSLPGVVEAIRKTGSFGDMDRRPLPKKDGIEEITSKHFFGFESIEKLHEWFGEDLTAYTDAGFVVNCYDVREERVVKGNRQVAFVRAGSKLIGPVFSQEFLLSNTSQGLEINESL